MKSEDIIDIIVDDQTVTDFFELCSHQDFINLAMRNNIKIPGFMAKNYYKVPLPLLKNNVIKQIKKKKSQINLLKDHINVLLKQYKDLDVEVFLHKIQLDQEISDSQAFAFFVLNYNHDFFENRELIEQNIANHNTFYKSVINESFVDIIQSMAQISNKKFQTQLNSLLNDHPMKNEWTSFFEQANSLKERLDSEFPKVNEGYYLKIVCDCVNEYSKWSVSEREALFQLALQDATFLSDYYRVSCNELITQKEVQKKDIERLTRKIKKQNKVLSDTQVDLEEKQKKINELSSEIEERENENKDLEKTVNKYLSELNESAKKTKMLEQDLEISMAKMENIENERDRVKGSLKLFTEDFLLISIIDKKLFNQCLNDSQYVLLNNPEDIIAKVEEMKNVDEKILFINTDGINSKFQFKIEKYLIGNSLNYRFISGGPNRVIRKLIYFFEGDKINEIDKTY
ncbi:hypothetical protein ACFP7A_13100 [Sporolactobacillus kofuensis]|uniref:Uncharacterized protein n=1 Tax=Sporolactobacillus kofuensis TaxID=269672 RepID=A0ABW1WIQ4_9BACL|nr:hypothetical protein [Sporolactobacillus kofuensis]MCO7176986.1 hypothetical protein [Sporolactobacillus kofuensis]